MGDQTVSVVIPTNRGGTYLQDAIASLTAQTHQPSEIILVDDGSPFPGLSTVAHELGVSYIRQDASGISVARNRGVAAAAGDWVAFLDDDDVWHPDRLRAQLDALTAHPDAIASHTGGWYMDSQGVEFGDGWPAPPASSAAMISGRVAAPRITTLLVRRDVYRRVGGCRTEMEPAEDNEFILRLLPLGEFVAVDRPLMGYRRHDANVTRRGLSGRVANARALRSLLKTARAGGDRDLAALLTQRMRAFRRSAAADNLGEAITAVREREWRYAGELSWWAVQRPVLSAAAVRHRLGARRAATSTESR